MDKFESEMIKDSNSLNFNIFKDFNEYIKVKDIGKTKRK